MDNDQKCDSYIKMYYVAVVSEQRSGNHLRLKGMKELRKGMRYIMKNMIVCRLWVTCYVADWNSSNGLDLYSTIRLSCRYPTSE
jgi:hypothetical protein